MKKFDLYKGIACCLFGLVLFTTAVILKLPSAYQITGFGGAWIGVGLQIIYGYSYWKKAKTQRNIPRNWARNIPNL